MPGLPDINWVQFGLTVFGSGAVSAAVTGYLSGQREAAIAAKAAAYTALRAALVLESYAHQCAEILANYEVYEGKHPDDPTDDRATQLPTLASYPADLDWRPLGSQLASSALGFQAEVEHARRSVAGAFDYDGDLGTEEIQHRAADIGYRAWTIASDLRRLNGLPQLEERQLGSWNYPALLARRRNGRRTG